MHPGGIEPPFPGPEPSVLSIRLGMRNIFPADIVSAGFYFIIFCTSEAHFHRDYFPHCQL